MKSSISQTFLHILPIYPYFLTMSTFGDNSRSEIDESELSDPLNTTAFNTETHATAGDVADQAMHGDFVEIGGKTYISVPRTANTRQGVKSSWIWDHGRELRLLAGNTPQKCWQCTYCGNIRPVDSTTYHAGVHLQNAHKLVKDPGSCVEDDNPQNIAQQVTNMAYKALVTSFQADRFRYLLIRWIVCMHITLTIVEHQTFRDLMLYVCPALEPFFVRTGKTIRRWIMAEYKKQRLCVKNELAQAKAMIHISFDLWTSPNSLGMVAVIAHFLDKDLKNRSLLIGMRRVRGSHSGENTAEAIIPVLVEMGVVSKLGFFIADNATVNDVTISLIFQKLRPDISQPSHRRVRCLGHIINLAAQAFLFGGDRQAFEEVQLINKDPISIIEAELAFWRKKGPLGKLHNIVTFIRRTPQRRESFQRCCNACKAEDDNFEGMSSSNFEFPRGLGISWY